MTVCRMKFVLWNGILVVEFHTDAGPLIFTAQDHTEFVDAFYRISQDRANKISSVWQGGLQHSISCRMEGLLQVWELDGQKMSTRFRCTLQTQRGKGK
jgi:hypothetical protein